MNRNVSIVVVLLVLVVIAGYLVWIRSRVQSAISPKVEEQIVATPTPVATATTSPSASASARPSATPGGKEATGSVKQRTPTASSAPRLTPSPTLSPIGR